MPGITPNLWFDTEAEEAAEFYCSIFPNSKVTSVTRYPEAEGSPGTPGSVMAVTWVLDGQPFTGINGGPMFQHSEAVSFAVNCADQAEIDYYWEKLTAGGGEESQCGWLKDRFGVSWQVVPANWEDVYRGGGEGAQRAFQAMMGMKKLDIAALQAAADGA